MELEAGGIGNCRTVRKGFNSVGEHVLHDVARSLAESPEKAGLLRIRFSWVRDSSPEMRIDKVSAVDKMGLPA